MTTQETIKKAVDYAKENNIKNIVVATTTGGNLTYLEDEKDLHIVGVTNAYDQGQNQMREEVRKHFEEICKTVSRLDSEGNILSFVKSI